MKLDIKPNPKFSNKDKPKVANINACKIEYNFLIKAYFLINLNIIEIIFENQEEDQVEQEIQPPTIMQVAAMLMIMQVTQTCLEILLQ